MTKNASILTRSVNCFFIVLRKSAGSNEKNLIVFINTHEHIIMHANVYNVPIYASTAHYYERNLLFTHVLLSTIPTQTVERQFFPSFHIEVRTS